jgi:hypothetical protein
VQPFYERHARLSRPSGPYHQRGRGTSYKRRFFENQVI